MATDLKSPMYWWLLGVLASVCGFVIAERVLDIKSQLQKQEERISRLERQDASTQQKLDQIIREIEQAQKTINRNTDLINRWVLPMDNYRRQ